MKNAKLIITKQIIIDEAKIFDIELSNKEVNEILNNLKEYMDNNFWDLIMARIDNSIAIIKAIKENKNI